MTWTADLRGAFPVLERLAYLNAGTDGPLPRAAVAAARAEWERMAAEGRWGPHWERRFALADALRARYAALLGAPVADVALTTCTTEGIARVLDAVPWRAGDEVLTAEGEHPGLLGPLSALRERGVGVRTAPPALLPEAVGPSTRLVACSHVGWVSGELAPVEALRDCGVPVLYDGAQGLGAIAVDVRALGCAAYAAAGQKWLCGPDGTGVLYLEPSFAASLDVRGPGYLNFEDAATLALHEDARRFETWALGAEAIAAALAAFDVLAAAGWERVLARGPQLAAQLADDLRAAGRTVAPRGHTTLVSWEQADPEGAVERLAAAGVVVRNLPGRPLVRASVGAWTSEDDLARLTAGCA